MATTAYPKVPVKAWTVLRAKAAAAPSTRFTPSAVAALLDMSSPNSARDNVVSHVRKLGLIDEDGALTARGNKWRIDSTYPEACQEMLDGIYPAELSSLTDDSGRPDKAQVKTWMQHQGFGGSNANSMAITYAMIAEKSPPEITVNDPSRSQPRRRESGSAAKRTSAAQPARPETIERQDSGADGKESAKSGPTVHLDIQIHIPAAATPEQIDQIFASMAKHLY